MSNKNKLKDGEESKCTDLFCIFCDKIIDSGCYVTEEKYEEEDDDEYSHLDCHMKNADNVGFDGWVQDHSQQNAQAEQHPTPKN